MKLLEPRAARIIASLLLSLAAFLACSSSLTAQGLEYDSKGKRDPFIDLLKQRSIPVEEVRIVPPPPLENRPPGLAGLLLSEVIVTGLASGPQQELVILRGVDNMTYFARTGTKLYDGYVDRLSGEEVAFIREQVDTKGQKRVSRVVKRMQTEDR